MAALSPSPWNSLVTIYILDASFLPSILFSSLSLFSCVSICTLVDRVLWFVLQNNERMNKICSFLVSKVLSYYFTAIPITATT